MAPAALLFLFLISRFSVTFASDPDQLQDICVADLGSTVKVNGFVCKQNPVVDDFFFSGLAKPASTANMFNSVVTAANVLKIPGLNTLGTSIARIDFAPGGLNPPHTHPRATEVIFVLEGELYVGFLTTANTLFSRTIGQGDVFVFPRGLVHFQKNIGTSPASVIAAFNSQLQGTVSISSNLFAANPAVDDEILAETFTIGVDDVQRIKYNFAPK